MSASRPKILVTCPVRHIKGVPEILESTGQVVYLVDPAAADVFREIADTDAIFCQPNKATVMIDAGVIDAAKHLKAICTASTGTHHIDTAHAEKRSVAILSVLDDPVIYKDTSTTELNFGLMLSALRLIPQSFDSVRSGEWDCNKFNGQQLNQLTVGIVGYERHGKWFANFCRPFGCRMIVYDPVREVKGEAVRRVDLDTLLAEADIFSLNAWWPPEQTPRIDRRWFAKMKPTVIIVNTARTDVVDEGDILDFLERNPKAVYATDVLENEISVDKSKCHLIQYARTHQNIIITPHLGGQTIYGQEVIYQRSAEMLKNFLAAGSQTR